jgi:hypothetical protein
MFWLALGTMLLLWSSFSARSKRVDALSSIALVLAVALTLWAVRVYPGRTEAVSLVAGTAAAALGVWLIGSSAPQWTRWVGLILGLAAGLFALFGPAQGLLH